MKWETKDKLQKTAIILFIICFIITIGWGYKHCQRNAVRKALYEGAANLSESVCIKLGSGICFRSSVGRAADL